MSKRRKRNPQSISKKDERIAELEEQLARALATIEKLQRQVEQLQAQVEELKRVGKRQATPFARREWVEHPRRAGRKAGQGQFSHRELPQVQRCQEKKVAELHGCPACGGRLQGIKKHEQYVTDIPVVEVKTTCFVTYSGYCGICHKRVRSRHPEQTSQATGAAGVMVGPRAKALAADLKHRLGVSYGKVSEVLSDSFGLRACRSGWCQADQKLAGMAQGVYAELVEAIRQCSCVHVDETGWRIGTLAAWLWVFTNQEVSVYTMGDRSSDVVVEMLGEQFQGVLTTDCYLAYDNRRLRSWLKQKCVAHLLRELKDMQENKNGRALHFARQVTAILREALALKTEKARLDPRLFAQRTQSLESRLDVLIAPTRRLSDHDNARFAKRLRKHRPHLLRFLYVDDLEATNNRAERMLRPAVITRKTNGCNRTRSGATTHAILASVLTTCHQHAVPVVDYLVQLQQFGGNPPPLIPAHTLQSSLPAPSASER